MRLKIRQLDLNSESDIKFFKDAKRLLTKIENFSKIVTKDWIFQTVKTRSNNSRYIFKPVWISDVSDGVFWNNARKFVLMSATILSAPDYANTLGIKEFEFLSIPSQFDPARREVRYTPVSSLSRKTLEDEMPKVIDRIAHILDSHPDEKGLIHTVSYFTAKRITETIKSDRLVTHDGSLTRQNLLDLFKSSHSPLVLVSPSMDRGIDLPDALCRFIIIVKVPYPDLGDRQVSARFYGSKYGRSWYAWQRIST